VTSRLDLVNNRNYAMGDERTALLSLRSRHKLLALHLLDEAQSPSALDETYLTEGAEFGERLVDLGDLARSKHFQRAVQ
jgi:hypothetical protein